MASEDTTTDVPPDPEHRSVWGRDHPSLTDLSSHAFELAPEPTGPNADDQWHLCRRPG